MLKEEEVRTRPCGCVYALATLTRKQISNLLHVNLQVADLDEIFRLSICHSDAIEDLLGDAGYDTFAVFVIDIRALRWQVC